MSIYPLHKLIPPHLPLERLPSPKLYSVYGFRIRSELPLCLPEADSSSEAHLHIHLAAEDFFSAHLHRARIQEIYPGWYSLAELSSGAVYVRWENLFHFIISPDGRHLYGAQLGPCAAESFHAYLLGQALSFALIKQGYEPLHATAVELGGRAVAFLGDSCVGKSTLAASFLSTGARLITDDLFVCLPSATGDLAVQPGPPRIKLFPSVAHALLSPDMFGVPMCPGSDKFVYPLYPDQMASGPVPLAALYLLGYPSDCADAPTVRIQPLSRLEVFVRITGSTFNARIQDPQRLKQLFSFAEAVTRAFPVKELAYPRQLTVLSRVRQAVLADLNDRHQ